MDKVRHLRLDVASSDLDAALVWLDSELAVEPDERDLAWAHSICTLSRYIHLGVWSENCPVAVVRKEVLPPLKKARDILLAQGRAKDFDENTKESMAAYRRNVEVRIKNLDNYLASLPSRFNADAADPEPPEDRSNQ